MDINPQAIGVGVGVAVSALFWWLLKGKASPEMLPVTKENYDTPVAKVSKLCIYPVKSCHRIEVESTDCLNRGLLYDRCWVIVDKNGSFCCSRKFPMMVKIQPELSFNGDGEVQLTLTAPGMDTLTLMQPPEDAKITAIKVWNMSGEGVSMGEEASRWVSKFLSLDDAQLYYMGPHHKARVLMNDQRWEDITLPWEETSFSDWSPVLIISEASVELLNSKLDTTMVIERFRPNIIVSGCLPHSEDGWGSVRIGDEVVLRGLKGCGRCKMTRVHPEEGYITGEEPLRTLREYRLHETVYQGAADPRFGKAPLFGYNFSVVTTGRISVGDTLYILS